MLKNNKDKWEQYLKSSSDVTTEGVYIIHGPPGSGKTFLAATASQYWPEEVPPASPVELKDMLWLGADAGATAGFQELRISLPDRYLDIGTMLAAEGANRGIKYAIEAVNHILSENSEIENIVVDTLSTVDKLFNVYFDGTCPTNKDGIKDTRAMYGNMKTAHTRFHSRLRGTGKRIIYLAHSKALRDTDDTEQANNRKAALPVGVNDIIPDITGSGKNVYINDASIEMVLLATRKGKEFKRIVYPMGAKGFSGKSRFQASLDEQEEPNLRKIFNKIQSGQQA